MSSAKLLKIKLEKTSKFLLIFVLISGWIFAGWPQIFDFPPKVQEASAAIPGYRSSGTFTAGTGAITPPYPADMAANDVCLLAVSSENQAITLTTANGFVAVPTWSPQGAGTAATDPASMLALYWKRTVGGDSAPVVADSINNTEGQIHCFSGVITSGDPWTTGAGGNDSAANDTTGVIPGATTAVDDALVVLFISTSLNGNSTVQCSGWTNADLANVTERTDNSSTQGLGGGHCMATGDKALQGTYGNTTVTMAATTYKGAISLALKPAPSTITVGTTGTQTSSMLIPSTNQYVGGAFTFIRNESTANVTSITVSETDATLSAQSYLANLDLYYETAGTCTYDGTETLFGTDTAFDASEDAVITGTMAVGTSQVCVYAVLDVVSGAPNADFFDLEITDPSTEVVVSAGVVSPATAVAISGSTQINLAPAVKMDHFRWRNDNGPQGNQPQTLYFNPTGNGFGTVEFSIVAAACASGSEWDCVDDGTADTQSTAPSSDLETSQLLLAAATDYYTLADDQLLAGSTITQLDITVAGADDVGNPNTSVTLGYCIVGGANDCGTNDTIGTAQAISGADQTKTEQFTGLSLSTTDLNNMQLVVTGSGAKAEISTLYVLVTYSVPEATWATGAEDQVLSTLAKNTNTRLRFQVDNTGGSANSYNYRLEWAARGVDNSCDISYTNESYVAVPDTATTEHFDMTLSAAPGYVDGEVTTAKLSNAESYTFVAGTTVESTSNQSGAITLAQNQYTEVEYVFQANSNATDSGVYCFRVTNAGTPLDSADVVAQVTLSGGGAAPTLSNNRLDRTTLTLNENTFVWASSSVLVTDTNGCSDISSVSAKLYLTSPANSGTLCSYDGNNCYVASSCVATTTGNQCSADNDVEYDCGFQIWYTAEATDTSAPTYSSSIWSVSATSTDSTALTGTATNTAQTVEVGTLNALSLSGNISYPETNPNNNTGATNQTVTVTNTGNTAIDAEISGDVMCTIYPSCSTSFFGPSQQRFGASNVTYASLANLLSATATPATIQINLAKPTSTTTPVTIDLFWGIAIPVGKATGVYTGQNIFTAVANI